MRRLDDWIQAEEDAAERRHKARKFTWGPGEVVAVIVSALVVLMMMFIAVGPWLS